MQIYHNLLKRKVLTGGFRLRWVLRGLGQHLLSLGAHSVSKEGAHGLVLPCLDVVRLKVSAVGRNERGEQTSRERETCRGEKGRQKDLQGRALREGSQPLCAGRTPPASPRRLNLF